MGHNTLLANPAKWFLAKDGAADLDFIKDNETLVSHGRIHKPISSAVILEKFRNKAKSLGLELGNEQAALLKEHKDKKTGIVSAGDRFIYTAEVLNEARPDYALSVGFRNFNDCSLAFSGMCASSVFVCENGLCHGLLKPSKMRHTIGNVNEGLIDTKIDYVFSRFLEDKDVIHHQIGTMKNTPLTDAIVNAFIKKCNGEWLDGKFVKNSVIGSTNLCRILAELENPSLNDRNDNSAFRLMNACTTVTTHKIANPNQSVVASNYCNNLIMSLIDEAFTPIGDTIDVTDESEVEED